MWGGAPDGLAGWTGFSGGHGLASRAASQAAATRCQLLLNQPTVQPQVVNRYIDQGVAELVPGVLFIDEVRGCNELRLV
jgi:hypothetical protein